MKKPLQGVRQTAKDLVAEAAELGVGDASHLLDDVDGISERLDDLQAKLDDRCSQLQSASTALAQYNVSKNFLSSNLNAYLIEIYSCYSLILFYRKIIGKSQRFEYQFVGLGTRIRFHETCWPRCEDRSISTGRYYQTH